MTRRVAFLWGSNGNNRHYPTLKYAKRDVERLGSTLRSSRYDFDVTIPSETSDRKLIQEALLEVMDSCETDDVFVAYFSGHGLLVNQHKLYLVLDQSLPYETKSMISATWLLDAIQECKARHRLLILDCCHAGAVEGVKGVTVSVDHLFSEYGRERILCASGKLEAARELHDLEGSFLTHALCQQLNEAAPGPVALSKIVDALQHTAHERNKQAPLQSRVPVPYLHYTRHEDFFFAPPPTNGSGSQLDLAQGTPPQPFPVNRRSALTRALSSVWRRVRAAASSAWIGLQAAASDGQGVYFFTMLAFGLSAFFFHDSLAIQHKGHDDLHSNAGREQDPLRATRFSAVEGLVLPTKKDLCDDKALVGALVATLESAYYSFQKSRDNAGPGPELEKYIDRRITAPGSQGAYRINSFYRLSPDGTPYTSFTSKSAASSPPELSVKDEIDRELVCVAPKSSTNALVVWTAPYFDLSRNGIVETICFKEQPADASSMRFCAVVAIPEKAIFEHLANADGALEIVTVRVPSDPCADRPQSCILALPRTRAKIENGDQIAAEYYEAFLKNGKLSADNKWRSEARGVWQEVWQNKRDSDVFGAVVHHQPALDSGEYWDIAIARIRDSRTRNYLSLSLSAMSLIIAVSFLVLGFRRKLRRQQYLLARGLQYGLLELREGRIVGANDRAEEILGRPLPRLGIHSAPVGSATTFSPLIHPTCMLFSPYREAPSEASYDGKIRDRAADGMTSVFYAWVKRTQMWVKVTSTVMLLPNDTGHVICALDTAIDPQHKGLLAATYARFEQRDSGRYDVVTP